MIFYALAILMSMFFAIVFTLLVMLVVESIQVLREVIKESRK